MWVLVGRHGATKPAGRVADAIWPGDIGNALIWDKAAATLTARCSSSSLRAEDIMWKGATVAAVFFLLAACAADEQQRKAQQEEYAKAAAEAEAQIAQQDHARCLSYGKPGSAGYIDCRSSLKNDRADMKK